MISKINRIIKAIKNLDTNQLELNIIHKKMWEFNKENQSLSGKIKLLEEQHEIMHNFLVEINKYLINLVNKKDK